MFKELNTNAMKFLIKVIIKINLGNFLIIILKMQIMNDIFSVVRILRHHLRKSQSVYCLVTRSTSIKLNLIFNIFPSSLTTSLSIDVHLIICILIFPQPQLPNSTSVSLSLFLSLSPSLSLSIFLFLSLSLFNMFISCLCFLSVVGTRLQNSYLRGVLDSSSEP